MLWWSYLAILPVVMIGVVILYSMLLTSVVFICLQRGYEVPYLRCVGMQHLNGCCWLTIRILHGLGLYTFLMLRLADKVHDNLKITRAGSTCVIGDSCFSFWMTMREDTAKMGKNVYNACFGGATSHHVLREMDRLVTPYSPKTVLLHVGSNDFDVYGERGFEDTVGAVQNICRSCTGIKFVFFGRRPGYSDKKWNYMRRLEERVRKFCIVVYVDTENFVYFPDGVHLDPSQYKVVARQLVQHM